MENEKDNILIDWLEYSVLDPDTEFKGLEVISYESDDFKKLESGLNGYKDRYICGNSGLVYLKNGSENMGHHIILSGKTCRYLENYNLNLLDVAISLASKENINITRLDLALDLYNKDIYSKCVRSYDKDLIVTKFRSSKKLVTKKDNKESGGTLYFGSRQSEVMLRIYDKGKEQKSELDWTRIEFVLKKLYTKKTLEQIKRKGLHDVFKGLLKNYIKFVKKKEKNVSRSVEAKWYKELIEDVSKISLYTAKTESDIESIKEWLKTQVSNSLYTIVQADLSHSFIDELLKIGANNIKDRHYNLIEQEHKKRKLGENENE